MQLGLALQCLSRAGPALVEVIKVSTPLRPMPLRLTHMNSTGCPHQVGNLAFWILSSTTSFDCISSIVEEAPYTVAATGRALSSLVVSQFVQAYRPTMT